MWEIIVLIVFVVGFLLAWYIAQRSERIHHERKIAILREKMKKTQEKKREKDERAYSSRDKRE